MTQVRSPRGSVTGLVWLVFEAQVGSASEIKRERSGRCSSRSGVPEWLCESSCLVCAMGERVDRSLLAAGGLFFRCADRRIANVLEEIEASCCCVSRPVQPKAQDLKLNRTRRSTRVRRADSVAGVLRSHAPADQAWRVEDAESESEERSGTDRTEFGLLGYVGPFRKEEVETGAQMSVGRTGESDWDRDDSFLAWSGGFQ